MRVLSVFGTRPEAVKMAPVVQELKRTKGMESLVCVTAQHREMLDQVLDLFQIKPDADLDLMREDQTLAQLSAGVFTKLDKTLDTLKPDLVLLQGDTTTVAIASLLSYYRRIRVGHVEAGLRTHDKWQPFPEEINRRVAGVVADIHFAPTEWAHQNLLSEGIPSSAIFVTGNPVIDALQQVAGIPEPKNITELLRKLNIRRPGITLPDQNHSRNLLLVTAHRRENFGRPLENICRALKKLAQRDDLEIVYPVHLNPNVQEPVHRLLDEIPHITLLQPQDYLSLVHLIKNSKIVLTDSGGIQEEAPAFGVPVLVLRDVTERPEGVEAGVLKIVGTEATTIVDVAENLLDDERMYLQMAKAVNPFGDGHAASRIVSAIKSFFTD